MKINISKRLLAILAVGTIGLTAYSIKEETPIKVEAEITMDNLEEDTKEITYLFALKDKIVRLNMDNKSNKIGFVPKETLIKVEKDCDEFVEVSINGIKGYIDKIDTKEIIKNASDNSYKKIVFMKKNTNIYKDNNEEIVLGKLSKYETAFVYDEDDTYYNVSSNGIGGFVLKEETEKLPSESIIVDISDQTVDLYSDNILVNNYKVITGTPTPTRETRTGYFEIFNITTNRHLKNEDGTDGVWVDVMMKFDEGRGFHDCTYQTDYNESGTIIRNHGWRDEKEFDEKDRYKYDGSHGCVNMINKDVKELYNNVSLGTKVLVKR